MFGNLEQCPETPSSECFLQFVYKLGASFILCYFSKILYFNCFSFEVLLQSLEKIKDAEFVTSLCISAQLPDITTTKKILNYAKERLARTAKV